MIEINDSLTNVVANLGTNRDKSSHNQFVFNEYDDYQLIQAYRGSWLPRAIVDTPAEDATRKWREWRAKADQITAIEAVENRLGVSRKIEQALKMSRLLGGAALYISTNEVDPSKPLRVDRIRDIRSLTMLTKLDLHPGPIIRDIDSPYYGKPETYRLTRKDGQPETIIHASRLVVFDGSHVPNSIGVGYRDAPLSGVTIDGWGDSVLQSVMEIVMQHDSAVANIVSLIFEAKVDVFRFDGYSDQLNADGGKAISKRLHLQAAMKGINGAVVIDQRDDYDSKSASFGTLDSILDRIGNLVAGAAEIPVTRLFGRSSAGLSGSGDGDERVYFDRVNHMQTNSIEPAMAILDQCILKVALGNVDPDVWYEWRPLRQVSEKERADIFKATADAARALAGSNAGELLPIDALSEALANELVEQGVLPGLDTALEEYGTLAELREGEDVDPEEPLEVE